MFPTLAPNEQVIVNRRAYRGREPQIGDVVVAVDPRRKGVELMKRVSAVNHHLSPKTYHLLGDNPDASTDSRHFGAVPLSNIVGKVTHKLVI